MYSQNNSLLVSSMVQSNPGNSIVAVAGVTGVCEAQFTSSWIIIVCDVGAGESG